MCPQEILRVIFLPFFPKIFGNTLIMRENGCNLSHAVERVKNLKGVELKLLINRGRNRFERVDGIIEDLYPNVFTVKTKSADTKILTLSYADVMMKNIKFFPRDKN